MVEKVPMRAQGVVDLQAYQAQRAATRLRLSARLCRHCGAKLADGETDDDCSAALIGCAPPLRLRAERG